MTFRRKQGAREFDQGITIDGILRWQPQRELLPFAVSASALIRDLPLRRGLTDEYSRPVRSSGSGDGRPGCQSRWSVGVDRRGGISPLRCRSEAALQIGVPCLPLRRPHPTGGCRVLSNGFPADCGPNRGAAGHFVLHRGSTRPWFVRSCDQTTSKPVVQKCAASPPSYSSNLIASDNKYSSGPMRAVDLG